MILGLLPAVALPGAVSEHLQSFASETRLSRSPSTRNQRFLRVVILSLSFFVGLGLVGGAASALAQSASSSKRLASIRTRATPEGSVVTLLSDSRLDDYTAYREADRFHIVLPQAEASQTSSSLRGPGFSSMQIDRRANELDISFFLQPGVIANVTQKFNRLEIAFRLPLEMVATVVKVAADISYTPEPLRGDVPTAQGANVALVVTPTPTPTPSSPPASSPAKEEGKSAATTKAAANTGIPPLPAEKANPVRIPKFNSAPVIDGKLDDAIWQSAAVFKDFYQINPGENIAPLKPTEVYVGYDAKTFYIAFRAFDEPDKVRATVAKRDSIFDDDYVGFFLDTFNDRRKAFEAFFNPLGIQADGVLTEGGGEDFSVDWVMESKGALTKDGFIVEVAIPFKSLRYEAGKDKLWGAHFFRRIKRNNNELDSWMPFSRSNSSNMSQAGHITGLEGISTERTIELIPSLTISETGKFVASFTPPPAGTVDPGRMVNEPIKFDPGLTAKFGLTPTVTLDLALNPDFAQVEADQTVVTANQRFPIFFEEKRPFFLEGIDIFRTPLTVVHTRAIIDPDVAVKLSGKRGRNTFGIMAASDNGPGNFVGDDRLSPNNFRFLDKNAYIAVLRLKRDLGKGEDTIGMIATTYNFIEKHNNVFGFDGRFRRDKKSVGSFQVVATNSRRFFFDPEQGQREYRTGNAIAYALRYEVDGRNFGWNYDGRGFTTNYRADVGFTRRTNNNRHGLFLYYNTDPKPKATLIRRHFHILPEIQFDWKGRIQSWGNELQTELGFKSQSFLGLGVSFNYERIFEEEFGSTRNAPVTRCFSAQQIQAAPGLHCGFAGDDNERSTQRNNIYGYAGTRPSKKYSLNTFMIYNWAAFDFDFGAGPKFPRVSPAALIDPNTAGLDPGKGNNLHLEAGGAYQPTNELRLSLDYTKDRLVRRDTGRVAFDENIFAFRATYQFTRFTFAKARVDYDTLASSIRGQFLMGWTPNPGTSLYVGYNDDLNYNGFGPFSGRIEPGFRRNGRTFFIKMSYLIRKSF